MGERIFTSLASACKALGGVGQYDACSLHPRFCARTSGRRLPPSSDPSLIAPSHPPFGPSFAQMFSNSCLSGGAGAFSRLPKVYARKCFCSTRGSAYQKKSTKHQNTFGLFIVYFFLFATSSSSTVCSCPILPHNLQKQLPDSPEATSTVLHPNPLPGRGAIAKQLPGEN